MLKIFKDYKNYESFFSCFAYLDRREDETRNSRDTDQEFIKDFAEKSQEYVAIQDKMKKKYNKGAEPFVTVSRKYEKGVNDEDLPENIEERFVITKKTSQKEKKPKSNKKNKVKKTEYQVKGTLEKGKTAEKEADDKNVDFYKNYEEKEEEEEIEKIDNRRKDEETTEEKKEEDGSVKKD